MSVETKLLLSGIVGLEIAGWEVSPGPGPVLHVPPVPGQGDHPDHLPAGHRDVSAGLPLGHGGREGVLREVRLILVFFLMD